LKEVFDISCQKPKRNAHHSIMYVHLDVKRAKRRFLIVQWQSWSSNVPHTHGQVKMYPPRTVKVLAL